MMVSATPKQIMVGHLPHTQHHMMQSDIEGASTIEVGTEVILAGQALATNCGSLLNGIRHGEADYCMLRQCCVCGQTFLLTGIARVI